MSRQGKQSDQPFAAASLGSGGSSSGRKVSKQVSRTRQSPITFFCTQHIKSLRKTMTRLINAPVTTLLTVGVIGLAMALPASFLILVQNSKALTQGWKQGAQVSLYLQQDCPADEAQQLIEQIRLRPDVVDAHYISPQEGLQLFEKESGFSNVVSQLPENPLPGVIEVFPSPALNSSAGLNDFYTSMKQLPHVANAQMDMQWLQRLFAIIELVGRLTWVLTGLFFVAVLLIVGNTIRTATDGERHEIFVMQLIGATMTMIRRPFLYMGFFYGLLGGALAWLVVTLLCWGLQTTFADLMSLYHSQMQLQDLAFLQGLALMSISALLGTFGAYLAIKRYL